MPSFFRTLRLCVLLLVAILSPEIVRGVPTVNCHCFQERQFDPARPTVVDPYLLATVQNRLIGHLFALPRQEIVRSKMSGVDGDRLWVAFWVARAAGRPASDGLMLRESAESWAGVVASSGASPERLGARFMVRLAAGADDASLAAAAREEALTGLLRASPTVVARLRDAGASEQELVAAVVLGGATGSDAAEVFRQVRRAGSWGEWMQQAGVTLPQLDAWIARVVSSAGR